MGKDNNIDGDNTVIFTVSPLATGIKFNPDNNDVHFKKVWEHIHTMIMFLRQ